MFVSKINQIKNQQFCGDLKKNTRNSDVVNVMNQNCVCSPAVANAIIASNNIQSNPYTFLQNINIPSLNLNGNLYILPNGQKCFIAKKEGPCIIKTFFKVGSMNEPDHLRGISHFIEHNLFNGSKNLLPTEFVKTVNERGGNYNASTGYVTTDYFIHSPLNNSNDLESFIKIHADMLSNPQFDEKMLEKEKGPVISEIQMVEDDPYNIANNTVLKNLFGIKSVSKDMIGGTTQNIKNITRDDVINYYKTHYTPNNATTVIIGDIDERETLDLLNKYFANFKNTTNNIKYHEPLSPIKSPIRQDIRMANTQSTIINLAFVGPKNNSNKTLTNALLMALSGYKNAKLTRTMRDVFIKVCSESISNLPNSPTALLITVNTSFNNEETLLKEIYLIIHDLAYKPMSEKELNIVKDKLKTQLKYASESNMEISNIIGHNIMSKGNLASLKMTEKNIDALTSNDIMLAAREFLNLNKASVCIVHPIKENKLSFGSNNKLNNDIKTYKTPNNANICLLNIPNSKLYSLNFEFSAPVTPDKAPLSAVLESMLSKGSSLISKADFYDIEDTNNISSKIRASYKGIELGYLCPKESMGIVVNQLKQNIFSPALTKENFERAKKEVTNSYLLVPKESYDRAIETLYKETPKAYSSREVYKKLDSINYEDIIEYFNKLMANSSLNIYATGDFSDKKILNSLYASVSSINKSFANKNLPKLNIKNFAENQIIVEIQDRNQADILQCYRIKETGNIKDTAAILILNEILGGNSNSRLFNDLREKQKLAYRVKSSYSCDNNEGILALRIFTTTDNEGKTNDNLKKSLNGFNYHINKLLTEKVTQKELNIAKQQIISKILFNQESTSGKNNMLTISMNSLYKEKYLPELLSALENTNADNIQTIANYYLKKPNVTSIVASKKTILGNKNYLESLGNLNCFNI